jgi:hypothetical protein
MNIALLRFNFMFDPIDTWTNMYQFEQDLNMFFASKGMSVETIKPVEGSGGERIMFIKKKRELVETQEEVKDKSIQQQKASLTANRGYDGRWRK